MGYWYCILVCFKLKYCNSIVLTVQAHLLIHFRGAEHDGCTAV